MVDRIGSFSGSIDVAHLAQEAQKIAQSGKTQKDAEAGGAAGARHAPSLDAAGGLPQMAPPNAADAGAVLSNLRDLPAITFSLAQIINLVLSLANQMRKTEREETVKEADAALTLGEEAADDLKESGMDMLIGSAIGASMKIVGAGVTLGGVAKTGDITDAQTVMNKMMPFQATSQVAGSIGDYGDGTMKYEGQVAQSQKEVHDAQGQRVKTIEESERQDATDEQQLIQSIIQTLEKQEESRHEAVRATA